VMAVATANVSSAFASGMIILPLHFGSRGFPFRICAADTFCSNYQYKP
jgi:hypothetical protein